MKNYQWVKEEIEKLLTAKFTNNSRSSWSAPIIVVPKGDGGKCLVIDHQALNKVTRKFTWPMPKIKDIFFNKKWSKVFLNSGSVKLVIIIYLWISFQYPKQHLIPLFDKYEYVKVPFGVSQAPAYFQELMTGSLKDFNFTIAYLDNIITFSRMTEEYLSHIKQVFERL